MSKQGRWVEMGSLISDEMLGAFAVSGEPNAIPGLIKARYGDLVDRTAAAYGGIPVDQQRRLVAELTAA